MAITLEANYSKKIGLPGYSSHQYGVTVKAELSDTEKIPEESERVYRMLQDAVDREIQQTGWLPGNGETGINGNGNGTGNHAADGRNGSHPQGFPSGDEWNCTPKQKDLILGIVAENGLEKREIEKLARERFGSGVRSLNRLEASGLIDELFEVYGSGGRKNRRPGGSGADRARAGNWKGGAR